MLNPLALPIHPALNHFPIAMLTAAWICLQIRYITGDLRWDDRSRLFELVGVVTLPLTIIAAFVDTRGIGFLVHPRTDAPLIWHMAAGLVAAAAFTGHYVWRGRHPPSDVERKRYVSDAVVPTLGMLALVAAGLFAGEMVYGR